MRTLGRRTDRRRRHHAGLWCGRCGWRKLSWRRRSRHAARHGRWRNCGPGCGRGHRRRGKWWGRRRGGGGRRRSWGSHHDRRLSDRRRQGGRGRRLRYRSGRPRCIGVSWGNLRHWRTLTGHREDSRANLATGPHAGLGDLGWIDPIDSRAGRTGDVHGPPWRAPPELRSPGSSDSGCWRRSTTNTEPGSVLA